MLDRHAVQELVRARVTAHAIAKQFGVSVCVFRTKPITHFGRRRSPISAEADHPFRSKPISDFGRCRSPVSVQADHPFRMKPIMT